MKSTFWQTKYRGKLTMQYVTLLLALLIAGCATTYKGPNAASLAKLCRAEGHTMRTFAGCLENKLDAAQPGWQEKDEDAAPVKYLLDYAKALGDRVVDGTMTDTEAFRLYVAENDNLVTQKRAAKSEAADRRSKSSAAAVAAGVMILNQQANRPIIYQQAPLLPYPSEQPIIIEQQRPYQFYDSRPYK